MDYLWQAKKASAVIGFIFILPIFIYEAYTRSNEVKNQEFEGFVIGKVYSSGSYIKIDNKEMGDFYSIENSKIYEIINVGDYIIKKKGKRSYTLIKKQDTIEFIESKEK